MPPIHRRLRNAALIALTGALLLPSAAHASNTQLSIMMDDDLLVYRDDATRDLALRNMQALGVDAVRVTVLWSVVADGLDGKPKNRKQKKALQANQKRFKKYGEASPKAYPPLNWNRYDGLARACKTLGLICYFDVTGPGPSWTHGTPPKQYAKDAKWWMPNPRHFYNFVRAVGTRYGGKYRDEDQGRRALPRVSMWSLWNEPNQGGWLRPQWLDGKPVSPSLYRSLYQFGFRALARSGHPLLNPATGVGDIILAGETAPINVARQTTTSAMGPKIFINELLCGPGSTGLGCSEFDKDGPIKAWAWAHHPYTKKNPPTQRDADPQAITLANFDELGTQLDQLSATGHIAAGMPLISTEFGYETNPPDPYAATTPDQQALYLQIGDYLTSIDPRVVGNTQFLLRDVPPNPRYRNGSRNYWGTYQSGLFYANGVAKPAQKAYTFPFLAIPAGHDPATGHPIVTIWGQIRFRANVLSPTAPDQVTLQFKPADGSSDWTDVGPIPVTNTYGYFISNNVQLAGPGQVRVKWSGPQLPFNADSLPEPVG